ncbi:hypothetical protein MMC30_001451 [Trapelia coarctata]|nr:hypothetical protein [Trapelia coarctata]
MSSSSDLSRGLAAPYAVRPTWTIRELQHTLEKGIPAANGPVLRIDINAIKDRKATFRNSIGDEEPPLKRIRTTPVRAQCLLTIWQTGAAKKEDPTYLVKQTKYCIIHAGIKESGERTASVTMDSPFYVKLDELHTKGPKPLNGYGNQLYDMQLTILQNSATETWPPFDFLSPTPKIPSRMETEGLVRFPMLLAQWRRLPQLPETSSESLLEVHAWQDLKRYKTKLSLKMDAAWSFPSSPLASHNATLRVDPSPARHLPSPVSDEESGGLKISVRWIFEGNWEHVHPLEFDGYLCPLCNRQSFSSMDSYHFHLINEHDLFRFELTVQARSSEKGQQSITAQVRVDVADTFRTKAGNALDDREMSWQRPATLFDLDAYLKGDERWVGNETGRAMHLAPPRPALEPSRSRSSDSFQVEAPSIVKSRSADEVPNIPPPARKKFTVPRAPPDIKFFRLTVKRPLKEGEWYSESDDEIDESWLLQKHSDTIESFADMLPSEKRFIKRYDRHMLGENLSSNLHFREALVRFCRINREWLHKVDMKKEFHKNAAKLVKQGLISSELYRDCTKIIGGNQDGSVKPEFAVNGNRKDETISPPDSPPRKPSSPIEARHDYGSCKCGKPIVDASQIIRCSNIDCPNPDYHFPCANLTTRPPSWLCRSCEKSPSSIQTNIRLASPGEDVPLPTFTPASSSQNARHRVEHLPSEKPRHRVAPFPPVSSKHSQVNGVESAARPKTTYMHSMVEDTDDHHTDATLEYIEDSDIYTGSESSDDDDDDDDEEEDFSDPERDVAMLLDD